MNCDCPSPAVRLLRREARVFMSSLVEELDRTIARLLHASVGIVSTITLYFSSEIFILTLLRILHWRRQSNAEVIVPFCMSGDISCSQIPQNSWAYPA